MRLLIIFLAAIPVLYCSACLAETIKGAGCPSEYFLMQEIAKEYQAKTGDIIMPGRNNNRISLKLLSEGKIDFAFCCEHHCQLAKSLGLAPDVYENWVSLPIAMDPIIIVIHKNLPIKSLTLDQLRDIYFGSATNWKQFGGPDLPIQPAAPAEREESGMALVFREQILKKSGIADWETLPYNNIVTLFSKELNPLQESTLAEMIFHVRKNPGGIGYFGHGNYHKAFGNIVNIGGVEPSRENILNGSYPTAARYYLVYDQTNTAKIQNFLNFVKSAEGRAIINTNFTATDTPPEACWDKTTHYPTIIKEAALIL